MFNFIKRTVGVLCLLPFVAVAQNNKKQIPSTIQLRYTTLQPTANAAQWWGDHKQFSKDTKEVILVFSKQIDASMRERLRNAGIVLRENIAQNTYNAEVRTGTNISTSAIGLYSILDVVPSWKVTYLPTANADKPVTMAVACYPGVTAQTLQQQLTAMGAVVLTSPFEANHVFNVSILPGKILELAKWKMVKTISPEAIDEPLNRESGCLTKANIAHTPIALGGYGLMGDSISIGIGDNSSGVNHIDLRDRIINYSPVRSVSHGMHINGIVGGAGIINIKGQGFAPHATLIDHLYNLVWARTGTMRANHNMTVTNNSYTNVQGNCAVGGSYDAYSQALDEVSLQYTDVLHIFASGNDGSRTCPPYVPGFATIAGSYQSAKNILVVSQTDKRYLWGINSSRGPVKDGRIKPEITAVGSEVYSTLNGNNYGASGGTSMSSPMVAGAAALVQQRYKQKNNNVVPQSALVKALLINGATDFGNPGPDYSFGFGMLNLNRTLAMLENNRFASYSITQSAQQTSIITVPANTAQIKVMLYWHDTVASALAAKQLINDLDLTVTSPSSQTTLPFILNPTPDSVTNNATRGVDTLNNVEQVVIDNPSAGNYTITVKGTHVPGNPQLYTLVWDFIPQGSSFTFPVKGSFVQSEDTMRVFWEASSDTSNFTLEFSSDNGANWAVLNSNIPATQRFYNWFVTGINSEQCKMRLTRNGTSDIIISDSFVANTIPVVTLDTAQCPGYMNITWNAIPNATGYKVLRKMGAQLQTIATVTDTSFSMGGLSQDSMYYAVVVPLIKGKEGYRSIAIARQPNNGNCLANYSNGDIALEKIVSPASGRKNTSSQLSSSASIAVRIRNLDDAAIASYSLAYSFNNGAWSSLSGMNFAGNGSLLVNIPAGLNLSAVGTYTLKVAVTNLSSTDPIRSNDTIVSIIRHLSNNPVNLYTGVLEDFEAFTATSVQKSALGIGADTRWDFVNSGSDTGRLRTFVNNDITISGNRSVSMDVIQFFPPTIVNKLIGTYNAAAYSTATDEVRMSFDYKIHGKSAFADSNRVWVRGADNLPWVRAYKYDMSATPGSVQKAKNISLTDALVASGQNFSASTQVQFGQRDSTLIAMNDYGTGITIDNVKIFTVQNDVALDSILSPIPIACNMGTVPVTIKVYNGISLALNNIRVSYKLDNNPIVTETIASLSGKTSVNYTFNQQVNVPANGAHNLLAWVSYPGDSYSANDTLQTTIRSQPLISTFPYLEDFEQNEGYWFAAGQNNSWDYGTPASPKVMAAASGVRAWKTNLTGNYNDNEASYLYSPCFNLSGMTTPMLSFSNINDLENCGNSVCDAAWVEYSIDNGNTWTKIGNYGEGHKWYTDSAHNIWNAQGNYTWHVSSIPLPVTNSDMRLRFVLNSDPGVGGEGLSIDDIHIYDKTYGLYDSATVTGNVQSVAGNQWINYLVNNKLAAQINPRGQNLGNTTLDVYARATVDTAGDQYYLQRNFVVNSTSQPTDTVLLRFYIPDSEVDSLLASTICTTCYKPADAYRLGVSKYTDSLKTNENGTLADDVYGKWKFFNYKKVQWVPYDNGYFVQLPVASFSEFWFNDGGPDTSLSLPNSPLYSNQFVAVYPNPTTDGYLTVKWKAGMQHSIGLRLDDITGRTIFRKDVDSLNGPNERRVFVGNLPAGIYILHCTIGEDTYPVKVLFK